MCPIFVNPQILGGTSDIGGIAVRTIQGCIGKARYTAVRVRIQDHIYRYGALASVFVAFNGTRFQRDPAVRAAEPEVAAPQGVIGVITGHFQGHGPPSAGYRADHGNDSQQHQKLQCKYNQDHLIAVYFHVHSLLSALRSSCSSRQGMPGPLSGRRFLSPAADNCQRIPLIRYTV